MGEIFISLPRRPHASPLHLLRVAAGFVANAIGRPYANKAQRSSIIIAVMFHCFARLCALVVLILTLSIRFISERNAKSRSHGWGIREPRR